MGSRYKFGESPNSLYKLSSIWFIVLSMNSGENL